MTTKQLNDTFEPQNYIFERQMNILLQLPVVIVSDESNGNLSVGKLVFKQDFVAKANYLYLRYDRSDADKSAKVIFPFLTAVSASGVLNQI